MFLGALIVSYLYFNKIESNENTLLHSSGIRSGVPPLSRNEFAAD
jgi:hypothetical protein